MTRVIKTLLYTLINKIIGGDVPEVSSATGTVASHLQRISTNIKNTYDLLRQRLTKDYTPQVFPIIENGTALQENSDNLEAYVALLNERKMSCGNEISEIDGLPEIPDGVSLAYILMNTEQQNRITCLKDNMINWTHNISTANLFRYYFPNVKKIELNCVSITNVLFDGTYSQIEEVSLPYLKSIYQSGTGIIPIKLASSLKSFSAPQLEICDANFQGTCLMNNSIVEKLDFPELYHYYGSNGSAFLTGNLELRELNMPKLRYFRFTSNVSPIRNCPKLQKVVIDSNSYYQASTDIDWLFATAQYFPEESSTNLIHLEIGASGGEQYSNIFFNRWNATMAIRTDTTASDYVDLREDAVRFSNNLEQFLYNFRQYIVLRLSYRVGLPSLTLTLSQNVRNAVNNTTITLGDLGITSDDLTAKEVAAGITTSTNFATWFNTYMTAINWNVSPTATN